jgi:hypothetical protein
VVDSLCDYDGLYFKNVFVFLLIVIGTNGTSRYWHLVVRYPISVIGTNGTSALMAPGGALFHQRYWHLWHQALMAPGGALFHQRYWHQALLAPGGALIPDRVQHHRVV